MWRRALAELVGTAFLVAAVIGSGIAAQRLSPTDVGLQLFENAAATAAALVAIILAVGPVSGAHLNPVVTLANRFLGGLGSRVAACYVGRAACWRCRRSCRRQPDVRPADRRAVDQDPQLGRNLAR